MLNWSELSSCSAGLEPAGQKPVALICQKAGSLVRGRLLIQTRRDALRRLCCCLDGASGEHLNAIMQLRPLNQRTEMENDLLQNSLQLPQLLQ